MSTVTIEVRSQAEASLLRKLAGRLRPDVPELGESELDQVAERMAAAVPEALAEAAGPVYTTSALRLWLGVSRQALHQRVKNRTLLAVTTSDGKVFYPSWQFTAAGEVVPGLPDVLRPLLDAGMSPWLAAAWLRAPDPMLGMPVSDWLQGGNDLARAAQLARGEAARWAA